MNVLETFWKVLGRNEMLNEPCQERNLNTIVFAAFYLALGSLARQTLLDFGNVPIIKVNPSAQLPHISIRTANKKNDKITGNIFWGRLLTVWFPSRGRPHAAH